MSHFLGKCIVNKDDALDVIDEIIAKMPDELKQAKWVKEAEEIVKEAENRIISMIDEHEITRKAYEKKVEIIENANEMAREITQGTNDYADNVLSEVETALEQALAVIQNNRKELK